MQKAGLITSGRFRTGLAIVLVLTLWSGSAWAQKATAVLTWGGKGIISGKFTLPGALAVDGSGNVFVCDSVDRIQKFSQYGQFITSFGVAGSGEGQLNSPSGLAVDVNGNVYVADWLNNRVQKFTNDGVFITAWGTQGSTDGQFLGPVSIDVDDSGVVYVVDQGNHRIQKFQGDGSFIEAWGTQGIGTGQLYWPRSAAISGNRIYITDSLARIQRFDLSGTFELSFGISGSNLGELRNPVNVAVDPTTGDVYVADAGNHRIQQFDADGIYKQFWGKFDTTPNRPLSSGDIGFFNYPLDVGFESGGDFFVADGRNDRIQRFSVGPLPVEPVTWGELKTKFGN